MQMGFYSLHYGLRIRSIVNSIGVLFLNGTDETMKPMSAIVTGELRSNLPHQTGDQASLWDFYTIRQRITRCGSLTGNEVSIYFCEVKQTQRIRDTFRAYCVSWERVGMSYCNMQTVSYCTGMPETAIGIRF